MQVACKVHVGEICHMEGLMCIERIMYENVDAVA